jgi:hypothetical protein
LGFQVNRIRKIISGRRNRVCKGVGGISVGFRVQGRGAETAGAGDWGGDFILP